MSRATTTEGGEHVAPRGDQEARSEEVGQEERKEEVDDARPADAGGEQRPRRGAILVARDDRGRVLLVRQRGGPFKGEWLLPGGGLEDGESFEDAMRREVREETGLEVRSARPAARYDVRFGDFHGDVQLFTGIVGAGELVVGADGEECAWTIVDSKAHPVLLRELYDAKATDLAEDLIGERLARAGIRMDRL